MTYTTADGQTVYDIALQLYGTIEQLRQILPSIESVTDIIPANTVLTLPDATPNAINEFFARRKPIATRSPEPPDPIDVDNIQAPNGEAIQTETGLTLTFL